MRALPLSLAAAGLLAACAGQPAPTPTPAPGGAGAAAGGGDAAAPGGNASGARARAMAAARARGRSGGGNGDPKPFDQVITDEALTKQGVFNVHQVDEKLFFEIPDDQLGKDFVAVISLKGSPEGIGIRGTLGGNRVIRFERRGNRVYVRDIDFNRFASDSTRSTPEAMALVQFYPIIASLPVEAYGADSAPVIDVTRMFTGGVREFLASGQRAQNDASRSYVERFAAFSRNVNVDAVQTYTPQASPGQGAARGRPEPTTTRYGFSIVRLPDEPMMPRLNDPRVGYFGASRTDFGTDDQRVVTKRYISRWRLECSDQKVGDLCVPKKPITYYVDPATPTWLVPWVKAGIEEWQPAFEKAGFSKGIVSAEAPDDPDFSGEDASVAMVRWLPSEVSNAVGPSTRDPRTGEIIDADVQMYHNIMDLQRRWYFTQVGHLDERAHTFPFPDSLMGRLVQFVVAHEVGHTLGFPHNFKGSSMYELDSIRSRSWVERMGHSPSIMDYARFNYVAQPEDNLPLETLVPRVGPYDEYAVMWGYTPIPGATSPEAERATLDEWARMQDSIPWYRFAGDAGARGSDPGEQSEAIGDADAVAATRLGFKNIARVMQLVEPAATVDKTGDFGLLENTYNAVIGQWATEANHVTRIIGGVNKQEKLPTQAGAVYEPVSKARQREAMRFLQEEVFETPDYLIVPEITRKLEDVGSIDRITRAQSRVLGSVVDNARMARMVELETAAESRRGVYTLSEMLTELRRGLWSEAYAGRAVDGYRRRLQQVYLDAMSSKIKPPPQSAAAAAARRRLGGRSVNLDDIRPILKEEMRTLDRDLARAIGRTRDRMTVAHLRDARDQIARMLDPTVD